MHKSNARNELRVPLLLKRLRVKECFGTGVLSNKQNQHGTNENDRLQLNVQTNEDGMLEGRGRIQGSYPIYLDDTTPYTRKLVERLHLDMLHRGVTLTMAKVRERHWIPHLRKLTKQVIKSCAGCKPFQVIALSNPPLVHYRWIVLRGALLSIRRSQFRRFN